MVLVQQQRNLTLVKIVVLLKLLKKKLEILEEEDKFFSISIKNFQNKILFLNTNIYIHIKYKKVYETNRHWLLF